MKTPYDFKVGDGATYSIGSDRYPCTVVDRTPARVKVQHDDAKFIGGNAMSESQQYEFTPNPNGGIMTFTLRKDGSWRQVGRGGGYLSPGRSKYLDPSF